MTLTLLTAASSTPSTVFNWGGDGTVCVYGTWDGATVTIQVSPDGSTWIDLEDATFTDDIATNINLNDLWQIRANISSAGGSTSLTAEIRGG